MYELPDGQVRPVLILLLFSVHLRCARGLPGTLHSCPPAPPPPLHIHPRAAPPPAHAGAQEIAVGTDRFAIPEVLFNPPLLEGYPRAAARLKEAGVFDGLQGIQHLANDCISK